MPFWTMQWYHLKSSTVSNVKYPLVNVDQPLTRQYHSGGRSKFQGNVNIPRLKKAGYMMEKLT
jgi:hypothetical protein